MHHTAVSESMILDERQAARYIGMSVSFLQQSRCPGTPCHGKGPKFLRIGDRAIRYRVADLDAFLESRVVHTAPHSSAFSHA